jgi:hypothetical protein
MVNMINRRGAIFQGAHPGWLSSVIPAERASDGAFSLYVRAYREQQPILDRPWQPQGLVPANGATALSVKTIWHDDNSV